MQTARIGLAVLGSTILAAAALWACSSDNGSATSSDTAPTEPASTSKPSPSSPSAGPAADPGAQPDPGDAGAGSDCGKPPTLHPPKAGSVGVYCPFSATAGGKNVTCAAGQQCCETPTSGTPSTCVAAGSACPVAKSTVWQCESAQDCGSGKKCCAHAADAGAVTVQQDTCGPYLSHFSGTSCQTSCTAGELVVCEQQSDCSSGTCTAVKPKGNDIGVCN
jgi:hypothetical protein